MIINLPHDGGEVHRLGDDVIVIRNLRGCGSGRGKKNNFNSFNSWCHSKNQLEKATSMSKWTPYFSTCINCYMLYMCTYALQGLGGGPFITRCRSGLLYIITVHNQPPIHVVCSKAVHPILNDRSLVCTTPKLCLSLSTTKHVVPLLRALLNIRAGTS